MHSVTGHRSPVISQRSEATHHPLRGSFFENMVVCELLKTRFNNGRDNRLMFFRDRTGHEVDVLYPVGPQLLPVEVKAGRTLQGEWFQGFAMVSGLSADFIQRGIVVFGGSEIQRRTLGIAGGIWQLAKMLDELATTPPVGG